MGKDAEFLDAARNGNVQVVEKFLTSKARRSGPLASLRRGPGANVQDSCGYTALHHASLNGHRNVVSALLRHEASINVQENKGSTALHLAAWAGNHQVIKVLLTQGPSLPHINHQNKAGDTALHFAAQYGHNDTVKILLSYNADPTLPNLKAETPFDLAAHFGRLEIAKLLIKQAQHDLLRPFTADAATAAVFPHTPLHLASRNGHLNVVNLLIDHGHHVNVRTSQGSALHEAALCGKVDVVRVLMEAGADAEVKNDLGHTVLDTISSIHTPVTNEISSLIKFGETISRHNKKDYRKNHHQKTASEGKYRLSTDTRRASDRYSDRDSAGRLSDCDGRMSVASDHSSYIYDIPPIRKKTKSDATAMSTRSSSTHNVLDEEVYDIPAPPKALQIRRSLRDLSDGELLNKPNPPPKPPRKSIYQPSRTPTDVDDESSYELISFASSGTNNDLTLDDPKGKLDSKSLTEYHHYKTINHVPPRQLKFDNYSTDSDDSDLDHRPQIINTHKAYSTMSFKPVKSRRTTKTNTYENTSHTYENIFHQKRSQESNNGVSLRNKNNNHQSPNRNSHKKTKSMGMRSKTTDFTSDDSEIDARPRSLRFKNSTSFSEKDNRRLSRDIETETEPEDSLVLGMQSTGVQGTSSLLATDDEGLNETKGSSSCSLSSASGGSDKSVSTDNIEEVKSDVPFAGLYRGSRSASAKYSSPSELPSVERPRSLTSPATTYRGFEKDFRSSYPSVKMNSTPSNNSTGKGGDKGGVLSPLEEDEEWARISDIMASFGGGVTRESVFMAELEQEFQQRLGMSLSPSQQKLINLASSVDAEAVSDVSKITAVSEDVGTWLNEHGLGQYEATLLAHGYDHTHFLNGILDNQELEDSGITDTGHREKILNLVGQLPPILPLISGGLTKSPSPYPNLSEWLALIHLSQYEKIFLDHGFKDMERVRKIWEVELTVVLEVTSPGHRKRMLSSLGNRPIEPELPASLAPQDLSLELSKLNTDISELKEKLFNELPFSTSREMRPSETATNTIRRGGGTLKRRAAPPPPPPKAPRVSKGGCFCGDPECNPLCCKDNKLSLRDPSQLVVGGPTSNYITQWKHHPTKLVDSNVQYLAQYLGSTHVKELKGTESTMKSIKKLRLSTREGAKVPKIILSVSVQGVRFIDGETRRVVCEHEIRNIHCACQDADDLTHFAYITKDIETMGHYCHVFRVHKKDLAAEIIMTLGEAFEVAYQIALRDQILANQSDEEKLAQGHPKSKSENNSSGIPKFGKERSYSLVEHAELINEGIKAPNTSLENLLSDSGNFSDKDGCVSSEGLNDHHCSSSAGRRQSRESHLSTSSSNSALTQGGGAPPSTSATNTGSGGGGAPPPIPPPPLAYSGRKNSRSDS